MNAHKNERRRRFFGSYGGRFVPEMLIPALEELEEAFFRQRKDSTFKAESAALLRDYAGRPTPLYFAENLTRKAGGGRKIGRAHV